MLKSLGGNEMAKRTLFNAFYFTAAVAVFGWMLRDNPHLRAIPILSMVAIGFYGLLAVIAIVKPNGFALSHEVLPAKRALCLRRLALLLPVPALLYFGLFSACMDHAGEWRILNKFYNPIARFEKASFSRDRMVSFVLNTQPRLLAAAQHHEITGDYRRAASYYKAATNLENRLFGKKLPSSYAIMGTIYERMGRHDKAERMFLRAEEAANAEACEEGRICSHTEVVSVSHLLKELSSNAIDANEKVAIRSAFPWLMSSFSNADLETSDVLGRQFVALNSSERHDWLRYGPCSHKCQDHKNCKEHDKHTCDDNCGDARNCTDSEHQDYCTYVSSHAGDCQDEHACSGSSLYTLNCNDDCSDENHEHDRIALPQIVSQYKTPTMTMTTFMSYRKLPPAKAKLPSPMSSNRLKFR